MQPQQTTKPEKQGDDSMKFPDRNGNVWDLKLTMRTALRIDGYNYDLYTKGQPFSILNIDKGTLEQLYTNSNLLFAIIYAIVEPTAKVFFRSQVEGSKETSQTQTSNSDNTDSEEESTTEDLYQQAFVDCLDGQSMLAAKKAFWRAIEDFFPGQGIGLFIQKMERLVQRMDETMQELSPEIDEEIEAMLQEGKKDLRNTIKNSRMEYSKKIQEEKLGTT